MATVAAVAAVALLMSRPGRSSWPPSSAGVRIATGEVVHSVGRAGAGLLAAVVVALLLFTRGSLLVLCLILAVAAAGAARLLASGKRRKEAVRREQQVLDCCEALVGELRAGQPQVAALGSCVETWPELEPVATAARLGADVSDALRAIGHRPGASGLREIAGAWQVSHGSGAGLAVALAQVAASARESQGTRRLVASELASARATARLVAALPVLALVMGSGVGGEPWHFLLATPGGLACLGGGLGLGFGGLFWIDRISAAVWSQ